MANTFNLTAQINLQGPKNLRKITSDIKRQLGSIDANVNLKLDAKSTKNIKDVTNALKGLSTIARSTQGNITSLNSSIQSLGAGFNRIAGNTAKLNNSIKNTGKNFKQGGKDVGVATTAIEEFGKQSALAVKRFAAFTIVTSVVNQFTNAISDAVGEFVAFDRQLIRIQQVTNASNASIQSLTGEITRLAKTFGVSSRELAEVSVTLSQAGLSATETRIALQALAKADLAPTFDNLKNTTEGAIAALRQFKLQTNDLEGALGSINAVAGQFAVESSDIITAIQRVGGVFAASSRGISEGQDALNEFIALFTSVRATTRESAETIATGLRTIFTRIQRGSTIDLLKEFGVNLQDLQGQFVGPYEAIRRLSEGLEGLSQRDVRFINIVEELGGFRQIGKVIPLLQEFATAQDALAVAQAGQGSLTNAATQAQQALAVQLAKVREEFLGLVRDIGTSDTFQVLAKTALGFASALIKVAGAFKPILPFLTALTAIKGAKFLTEFGTGFAGALKGAGGAKGVGSAAGGALGGKSDKTASLNRNTSALDNLTKAVNNLSGKLGGGGGGAVRGGTGPFGFGPPKAFARGGSVPGTGNRDTVPAMLQPGEFVIRKSAVQAFGAGNLASINKYANGDIVKKSVSVPKKPLTSRSLASSQLPEQAKAVVKGIMFENDFASAFGTDITAGAFPDIKDKTIAQAIGGPQAQALELKYADTPGTRSKYKKSLGDIPSSQIPMVVRKAKGGGISGSDTVPALLTPGEFVVNKKSAQSFGYGNLKKINGYNKGGVVGGVQTFQDGGIVANAKTAIVRIDKALAAVGGFGTAVGAATSVVAGYSDQFGESLNALTGTAVTASASFKSVTQGLQGLGQGIASGSVLGGQIGGRRGAVIGGLVSGLTGAVSGALEGYQQGLLRIQEEAALAARNDLEIAQQELATALDDQEIKDAYANQVSAANDLIKAQRDAADTADSTLVRLGSTARDLGTTFLNVLGIVASARLALGKSKGGPIYASAGQLVNMKPKGTDTVPAMLTPGEFVVNARSTKKNRAVLEAINKSKGGAIGNPQYLALGGTARTAADFVPFVGSGLDAFEGALDLTKGKWTSGLGKLGMGIAGLALDAFTGGFGSIAKGAIKGAGKNLAKNTVKGLAKEAATSSATAKAGKGLFTSILEKIGLGKMARGRAAVTAGRQGRLSSAVTEAAQKSPAALGQKVVGKQTRGTVTALKTLGKSVVNANGKVKLLAAGAATAYGAYKISTGLFGRNAEAVEKSIQAQLTAVEQTRKLGESFAQNAAILAEGTQFDVQESAARLQLGGDARNQAFLDLASDASILGQQLKTSQTSVDEYRASLLRQKIAQEGLTGIKADDRFNEITKAIEEGTEEGKKYTDAIDRQIIATEKQLTVTLAGSKATKALNTEISQLAFLANNLSSKFAIVNASFVESTRSSEAFASAIQGRFDPSAAVSRKDQAVLGNVGGATASELRTAIENVAQGAGAGGGRIREIGGIVEAGKVFTRISQMDPAAFNQLSQTGGLTQLLDEELAGINISEDLKAQLSAALAGSEEASKRFQKTITDANKILLDTAKQEAEAKQRILEAESKLADVLLRRQDLEIQAGQARVGDQLDIRAAAGGTVTAGERARLTNIARQEQLKTITAGGIARGGKSDVEFAGETIRKLSAKASEGLNASEQAALTAARSFLNAAKNGDFLSTKLEILREKSARLAEQQDQLKNAITNPQEALKNLGREAAIARGQITDPTQILKGLQSLESRRGATDPAAFANLVTQLTSGGIEAAERTGQTGLAEVLRREQARLLGTGVPGERAAQSAARERQAAFGEDRQILEQEKARREQDITSARRTQNAIGSAINNLDTAFTNFARRVNEITEQLGGANPAAAVPAQPQGGAALSAVRPRQSIPRAAASAIANQVAVLDTSGAQPVTVQADSTVTHVVKAEITDPAGIVKQAEDRAVVTAVTTMAALINKSTNGQFTIQTDEALKNINLPNQQQPQQAKV